MVPVGEVGAAAKEGAAKHPCAHGIYHEGLQSVLFLRTVVHVYVYKGAVEFGNISINFPERFVGVAMVG